MLPNFYPVLLCNTAVPLRPRIADTSSLLSKMRNVKKSVLMLTKCFYIHIHVGIHHHNVGCPVSIWFRDAIWADNMRSASTSLHHKSIEANLKMPTKITLVIDYPDRVMVLQ